MKLATVVGAVGGVLYSGFTLYSMATAIPYDTWNAINNVLFVANLAALLMMAGYLGSQRRPSASNALAVLTCSALFHGLFLLAYVVSTWFFADYLVQLPFFLKDYTYHGYTSVPQYLFTGDNYLELLKLQLFSGLIILVAQSLLGLAVAAISLKVTRRRVSAPSQA